MWKRIDNSPCLGYCSVQNGRENIFQTDLRKHVVHVVVSFHKMGNEGERFVTQVILKRSH